MNFYKWIFLVLVLCALPKVVLPQSAKPLSDLEKAYQLYKSHKYSSALNVFANASESNPDEFSKFLIIKGFVLMDSISVVEGRKQFKQAEKLLENSSDIHTKCKNYFGLGKGYFLENDFYTSIKCFLKMELEAIKTKLQPEQKTADYYLALNYQSLQQIPISNIYCKKAIQLAKEIKDSVSVFRCNYTLAANYVYYTTYESRTFKYADSILEIIEDSKKYINKDDYHEQGLLHDLYAKAYNSRNDYVNRKIHALLALDYYLKAADSANIVGGYMSVTLACIDLNQFDSALYCQDKANALNGKNNLGSGNLRTFYYNYYKIYKGLGNNEKAFSFLEKCFYQDREMNRENDIRIQQMREDFETEKTNLRIANEAERTEALYNQKRNFYLYIGVAILLILILMAYFVYYRLKNKKEKEQRTLELLLQNAELTALKAQMNPHFIFNALNSIQHSIVTNNTEEAYRFLSKFSKLIRNVLDGSSEQIVPLKTEIENLSLYVEIESKRFDNSFSFEVIVLDNDFSTEEVFVPPMILQPFVENAIWHGLMPKEGAKKLTVKFSIENENVIVCEISDNGIGREKAKQIASEKRKSHKSKGISNIVDRVKLLAITHSIQINIDIVDEKDTDAAPSGTKVVVKIIKEK